MSRNFSLVHYCRTCFTVCTSLWGDVAIDVGMKVYGTATRFELSQLNQHKDVEPEQGICGSPGDEPGIFRRGRGNESMMYRKRRRRATLLGVRASDI